MAKKGKTPERPQDRRPRLSEHPRAQRQINQAKAWGGLVGFALVGMLAVQAGSTDADALTRALLAGIAVYLAAWVLAVVVWRQLARAEVMAAERTWLTRLEEQRARDDVAAQEKAAVRAAERAATSAL